MPKRWIAIVNRTDAKMFSERPFTRVAQLRNVLGRAKNREMTRGKQMLSRGSFAGSKGMHAVGVKNPHDDAAVDFAKRIAEYLRKAYATNRFDDLMLVAEPKMLGWVKTEMDKNVIEVTEWVRKDLANLKPHEIPQALHLRVGRTR